MSYDLDYLEAMQDGNPDRLFLRLAIVGHSNFSCPITGIVLDVDRSFMIEVTHPGGRQEWLGPFDKSVYESSDSDAITWLKQFLLNAGHEISGDIDLREIKG